MSREERPKGDGEPPPLAAMEEADDESLENTEQNLNVDPQLKQILQILTSSSNQNQLNKSQVITLIKAIIKWEKLIVVSDNEEEQDSQYRANGQFFGPFLALAAYSIMANASLIPKSQIPLAAQSCSIIMQYMLYQIQNFNHVINQYEHTDQLSSSGSKDDFCLQKHQLMSIIQGLCEDVPPLLKQDVTNLISSIKAAQVPEAFIIKTTSTPSGPFGREGDDIPSRVRQSSLSSLSQQGLSFESSFRDYCKVRQDHSCESIIEQLMTPMIGDGKCRDSNADSEKSLSPTLVASSTMHFGPGSGLLSTPPMLIQSSSHSGPSSKTLLLAKNLFNLQQIGGANVLLDWIISLPTIEPYIHLVQATEEGAPLKLPLTHADALAVNRCVRNLYKDYDILWRSITLPILEPLTEDRLSKVITIIHACLYISLNLTCASILTSVASSSPSMKSQTTGQAGPSTTAQNLSTSPSGADIDDRDIAYNVTQIVDTSIEIYKRVMLVLKGSIRVGGQVCQNAHMFASWLLLSGLKNILKTSGSLASSSSSAYSTATAGKESSGIPGAAARLKQGFNSNSVSLSSHAVALLCSLFDDLKSEMTNTGSFYRLPAASEKLSEKSSSSASSFKYNKFGYYSAWQRIEMLMLNLNLTNLLFGLASVSYRKAGLLRLFTVPHSFLASSSSGAVAAAVTKLKDSDLNQQQIVLQDFDTDDQLYSSDDSSSRDDDSEPMLGQLFKEVEHDDKNGSKLANFDGSYSGSYTGDKHEQQRFLSLATRIIDCLNQYFVCSEITNLQQYFKSTVSDTQIIILSNIIKDLDRENEMVLTNEAYLEFSKVLNSFMHNLFAMNMLGDTLQKNLLASLGILPSPSEDGMWPLHVAPRSLCILTQIILLKYQKEKDELKMDTGAPIIKIWQHLLNHLQKLILSGSSSGESEISATIDSGSATSLHCPPVEDINVEHAQTLLFLFQNMKILHRKNVLSIVAQKIVSVASVVEKPMTTIQVHFLGRLLHFFEYMVKTLYEVPTFLVEQIDNNLFKCHSNSVDSPGTSSAAAMGGASGRSAIGRDKELGSAKLFCHCREIEDGYQKALGNLSRGSSPSSSSYGNDPNFTSAQRPRYYHLINVDPVQTIMKEVPKLDGMALSFLLVGFEDIIPYNALYDSLIKLLYVGSQCDDHGQRPTLSERGEKRISSLIPSATTHICAVQYTFGVVWRLVLQMPPSLKILEELRSPSPPIEPARVIQAIVWMPRIANNKSVFTWLRDTLSKINQINPHLRIEELIKDVNKNTLSIPYNIKLAINFIERQIGLIAGNLSLPDSDRIDEERLPKLLDLFVTELVLARVNTLIEGPATVSEESAITSAPSSSSGVASDSSKFYLADTKLALRDLLPCLLKLMGVYTNCIRWSLLYEMCHDEDVSIDGFDCSANTLLAYNSILRITSSKATTKLTNYTATIFNNLPKALIKIIDNWNLHIVNSSPPPSSSTFASPPSSSKSSDSNERISNQQPQSRDAIVSLIQIWHYGNLTNYGSPLNVNPSRKHLLSTLIRLIEEVYRCSDPNIRHSEQFIKTMLPLQLDVTLESFANHAMSALEECLKTKDSDEFQTAVYTEALRHCYDLLIHYDFVEERILIECLRLIESLLDTTPGQMALERFFCDTEDNDMISLLMSASKDHLSPNYSARVMKLFTKLFQQTDKNPDTISLVRLCTSLSKLSRDPSVLQRWLEKIICTPPSTPVHEAPSITEYNENRELLKSLTNYIVKENSAVDEDVGQAFLAAFIPMGAEILNSSTPEQKINFSELMIMMSTLANGGSGQGHLSLVKAVISWLDICKKYLSQKDAIEKLEQSVPGGKHNLMLESCCYMLNYMAEIFDAMKLLTVYTTQDGYRAFIDDDNEIGTGSVPAHGASGGNYGDIDSDWADDLGLAVGGAEDDEESTGEESDEDSLSNKLCTFTVTQKEFMNQHWYHCHTCRMVDGVGVCTVCAKVCHKDHDVTYAKYGSFFCDCGAKEDGSCIALTKRVSETTNNGHSSQQHQQQQTPLGPASVPPTSGFSSINSHDLGGPSGIRRRASSPAIPSAGVSSRSDMIKTDEDQLISVLHNRDQTNLTRHQYLARQLEPNKQEMLKLLSESSICETLLQVLRFLMPAIVESANRNSSIGSSIRAKRALHDLHTIEKTFEQSDTLMVPTLGSQEGAFENVRMSFTGEQGQTIRQLMNTNALRRVAMTVLSSPPPQGRRQHLAVSHEKGKITLLQLSTLLKQADSSKRKLTLTRLASAPIPFTVISIAANPCNEDVLAVCGLKDVHILTFNHAGVVSGHIVLHPQLEAGNYVIKAVWLPGSQTELAVVTADFIKVYDLAVDINNPQFNFLLPSGKVRDVTFIFKDKSSKDNPDRHLMLISSLGHIYAQQMNEESNARNGPFYMTTIVDVRHPEVRENAGLINSGGVSIYYSHTFNLLFFSFCNGKSFMAPLPEVQSELRGIFVLDIKTTIITSGPNGAASTKTSGTNGASSNGSVSGSNQAQSQPSGSSSNGAPPLMSVSVSTSGQQPLCQWQEIPGHPGLVMAMCQQSNNPVILMIKPSSIVVQEIRFLSSKAKITDFVAIRHSTAMNDMRTTLILLCEDGSLRIYMAGQESTNYWLRPQLCSGSGSIYDIIGASSGGYYMGKARKKRSGKSAATSSIMNNRRGSQNTGSGSSPIFPVDFFEHCTLMSDIEFGGNDVLQIYNSQQLKSRLNTTGMYIASTKPMGFSVTAINNDPNMVICGVRVLVGSQDILRAPTSIEIFGRSIPIYPSRNRWYDIPFTREESLTCDRKVNIFFGASNDPNGVTMVDSLKVYGNLKDQFGWPDDGEEMVAGIGNGTGSATNHGAAGAIYDEPSGFASGYYQHQQSLSSIDQLLSCSLEALDGCFILGTVSSSTNENNKIEDDRNRLKKMTLDLATRLLTLPYPIVIQQNLKNLLSALHPNRSAFNNHRDHALISYVMDSLESAAHKDELDGEAFFRLLTITKSIANVRPGNLIKFSERFAIADSMSGGHSNLVCDRRDLLDNREQLIELQPLLSKSASMDNSQELSQSQSCTDFTYSTSAPGQTRHEFPYRSTSDTLFLDDEMDKLSSPLSPETRLRTVLGTITSASSTAVTTPVIQTGSSCTSFVLFLNEIFWQLYDMRPHNTVLSSVAKSGLVHTDATVQALIEIIHAFTLFDLSCVSVASELYLKLLLCQDSTISFAAKQTLIRILRPRARKKRVHIPPTPACESPSTSVTSATPAEASDRRIVQQTPSSAASRAQSVGSSTGGAAGSSLYPQVEEIASPSDPNFEILVFDDMAAAPPPPPPPPNPVESLMAGHGGPFAPLLGLPADADDDAMVELAIALSLQDQQSPEQSVPTAHRASRAPRDPAGADNMALEQVMEGPSGSGVSHRSVHPPSEDRGHQSDTTASAAGSDDEGSTAATDGSTLRTSPVPDPHDPHVVIVQNPEVERGSESGGSGADSIVGEHMTSGRSSAYGEDGLGLAPSGSVSNAGSSAYGEDGLGLAPSASASNAGSSVALVETRGQTSKESLPEGGEPGISENQFAGEFDATEALNRKLRSVRVALLEQLVSSFPSIRDDNIDGIRVIPLMQVVLVLSSDMDGSEREQESEVMSKLLNGLLKELYWSANDASQVVPRSPNNEVKLIIMRLFSIMMSRAKGPSSSSSKLSSEGVIGSSSASASAFCSSMTAAALIKSNIMDFCLKILTDLLQYWKNLQIDEKESGGASTSSSGSSSSLPTQASQTLLKKTNMYSPPDMSPFFLRQYVKGHANDVFEGFPQLLTEMVLRLPYQIAKITSSTPAIIMNLANFSFAQPPDSGLSSSEGPLYQQMLFTPSSQPSLGSRSSMKASSHNVNQILFAQAWTECLCEYMMISNLTSYVRKQVRKLLSFICGSKDKYRQVRDFHALDSHMKEIRAIARSRGGFIETQLDHQVPISLNYEQMIVLIEHLKACNEIASNRPINWQKFAQQRDPLALVFFFQASYLLPEGVAPIIIGLLQAALCSKSTSSSSASPTSSSESRGPSSSRAGSVQREVSLNVPSQSTSEMQESEQMRLSTTLAQHLMKSINQSVLSQFVTCFLLESNSTSLRWQAHSLMYNLWKNFLPQQQNVLLETLWTLWGKLPLYGRKAVQFVDLLGYLTLKAQSIDENKIVERALSVLRQQNNMLKKHPNANLYNSLQSLVEFDGYYLESEPCLVCNNPEVNYANLKLSSIKVDSRFTTTTQIVKLIGSHTISKISLRISEIKRSKMVKTLNIYYNNRSVHSVVELKNKSGIWNKAKKYSLAPGQTDVKIEFPMPIIACNLMIEYAEFYENIQASSETLQCPRCSASVPATPGICSNCGENVFQCHKCRAINYDEKDPFLCNSCGFCKYAKFDYTLVAKPTCAVDPIESEEDRKKTVQSINNLLEKADRVYKNLIANKPALEMLLLRIQEHGLTDSRTQDDASLHVTLAPIGAAAQAAGAPTPASLSTGSGAHVNRAIQQVAQRYCQECKAAFDELSKIIQRVLASRKELVEYDNRQRDRSSAQASSRTSGPSVSTNTGNAVASGSSAASRRESRVLSSLASASTRCYGCAAATVESCIMLLKALATLPRYRQLLCSSGLIKELIDYNLRNGAVQVRHEVRQLLCTLTRDNVRATLELNNILMEKITVALKNRSGADFAAAVRHEVALLANSLDKEDSLWEHRLRCVMKLFLMGLNMESPAVLECLTLPCLKLLQSLIRPEPPSTKKNKDKSVEQLATVKADRGFQVTVDLNKWLAGDNRHSFKQWKGSSVRKPTTPSVTIVSTLPTKDDPFRSLHKESPHSTYLIEKYSNRWREKVAQRKVAMNQSSARLAVVHLLHNNWLKKVLFNPISRQVRLMGCSLLEALFQVPSRQAEIIDMLTSYLDDLGTAGESAQEFFALYHNMIQQEHWKYYLAIRGQLIHLGNLITREIDHLQELEETTLNSDLSQGLALKMLIDLLTVFVDVDEIRRQYKSKLVGFVLNGYLSLRKLVVQRTKVIDEAQETLLELLEEMTSGTEEETAGFMEVCVNSVNKCRLDDLRTPVFIFERLCLIIYPEENDAAEFFITLEKDPQQEDFLQGRMLGNPYSSNEPGMGPLMRDIKNKICQDCELVALLEDDSGMELLVNNKIISLDLPVKQVYKKIWCQEGSGGTSADGGASDAMKIVYRMRGLMGDATEEFIETLDSKDEAQVDNEQVYKMANVMARCGGLEVMLERLGQIEDLSPRSRPLLFVLLKLFSHCVKVKTCRERLIEPKLHAIGTKLSILKLMLTSSPSDLNSAAASLSTTASSGASGQAAHPLDQLLCIMEVILQEASCLSPELYDVFCQTCGSCDDIKQLLTLVNDSSVVRGSSHLLAQLMRVLPFLTYGNQEKMLILLNYFKPHLNFNKFDFEHNHIDDVHIEQFCLLVVGIERNTNGSRLKDLIISENIANDAMEYLVLHAPPVKSALLSSSEEWKEFTGKPALKYVLRILTGLSQGHSQTQLLVSADCIPIIHGLEQVSSDTHVGSLAENLLEAIKQNPEVAVKIEQVRRQTREEKKRLAMAVREKQLGALGLRTNERGQVTAKSTKLSQVEDLGEEAGLVCIICREGYKFQPTKVLGIYTFTKRCPVEEYEARPRKTLGYSTVTHFNVVHVDCHMAAVRHARGRDEWESAALQNANTRCNGLLPIWGPQVQESAFASCLARHNSYIQDCTGHRDVSYTSTLHDLKLLLIKFAYEKSFSEDSGGGGPESNLHLIPYLMHMALYVINTTRASKREANKIQNFVEAPPSKWIENCYEAESPYYHAALFLVIHPPNQWNRMKMKFLQRFILLAQARHVCPQGASTISDFSVKDFSVYRPALFFFAMIETVYFTLFKNVTRDDDWPSDWSVTLAEYIRHHDQELLEAGEKALRFYQDDLLPTASFAEFCDVMALHNEIPDPDSYLSNVALALNPI